MGLELPKPGTVFLPSLPAKAELDPVVKDYLADLKRVLERHFEEFYSNDLTLANAINSGTSGTFTLSSGGSIVVTSGVVITVTS